MNTPTRPCLKIAPAFGSVVAALLFSCLAGPGFAETPAPAAAQAAPVPRMPEMPCARPKYPKEAQRNRSQGTVTMEFLISPGGDVIDSRIKKSSGFGLLDITALTATAKCKFLPTMDGDKPVQGWVVTQYAWELDS